jgi:hypothetical protein
VVKKWVVGGQPTSSPFGHFVVQKEFLACPLTPYPKKAGAVV